MTHKYSDVLLPSKRYRKKPQTKALPLTPNFCVHTTLSIKSRLSKIENKTDKGKKNILLSYNMKQLLEKRVDYKIRIKKKKKSCERKSGKFYDIKEAHIALQDLEEKGLLIPFRIYKCEECKRYHFTSKSLEEYGENYELTLREEQKRVEKFNHMILYGYKSKKIKRKSRKKKIR